MTDKSQTTEPQVNGMPPYPDPVDLTDAERLAQWCVFWSEFPHAPSHAAYAAAMIRAQAREIERLNRMLQHD